MKNYNVEAIINFTDVEENIYRVAGDIFKCTKERYEYLMGNNPKGKVAVKLLNIDEVKKEENIEVQLMTSQVEPIEVKKTKKATKRKVK